jgi:hypothetical protein
VGQLVITFADTGSKTLSSLFLGLFSQRIVPSSAPASLSLRPNRNYA